MLNNLDTWLASVLRDKFGSQSTSKQAVRGDMDLRNVKNKKHFSIVSPVAFGVYVYEVRK